MPKQHIEATYIRGEFFDYEGNKLPETFEGNVFVFVQGESIPFRTYLDHSGRNWEILNN